MAGRRFPEGAASACRRYDHVVSALDDVLAAFGTVGTVVGASSAFLVYRLTRSQHSQSEREKQISAVAHEEYEPLSKQLADIQSQLQVLTGHHTQMREDVGTLATAQSTMRDDIVVLKTKMDVFWKNVALDAARVLHSPNPARAHVDKLLEAFMDGRLGPTGRRELKSLLGQIRDYHLGDPSDFPIYPGDQVAAAILLTTMDLAGV